MTTELARIVKPEKKYVISRVRSVAWVRSSRIQDNAQSVVEDVKRIRSNSMVPSDIPIYGYIYDCKTGALLEVPEATAAGRAA